jgi:hypothetical protein
MPSPSQDQVRSYRRPAEHQQSQEKGEDQTGGQPHNKILVAPEELVTCSTIEGHREAHSIIGLSSPETEGQPMQQLMEGQQEQINDATDPQPDKQVQKIGAPYRPAVERPPDERQYSQGAKAHQPDEKEQKT